MEADTVGKNVVLEGHVLDPGDAERYRAASERAARCAKALTEANMALQELSLELVGEYSRRADREELAEGYRANAREGIRDNG